MCDSWSSTRAYRTLFCTTFVPAGVPIRDIIKVCCSRAIIAQNIGIVRRV